MDAYGQKKGCPVYKPPSCNPVPQPCTGADTPPKDGSKGDCPSTLAPGATCTVACDAGYKCKSNTDPAKPCEGTAITIAKDDQTILTGWVDGFLRAFVPGQGQIWEIANATRGAITSIYADANYILTGGADGAVRVWAR